MPPFFFHGWWVRYRRLLLAILLARGTRRRRGSGCLTWNQRKQGCELRRVARDGRALVQSVRRRWKGVEARRRSVMQGAVAGGSKASGCKGVRTGDGMQWAMVQERESGGTWLLRCISLMRVREW
jgi:hypothetical protein